MSQGSTKIPTTGPLTGLQLVQDVNAALANLASNASGATDPSTLPDGVQPLSLWLDTSVSPYVLRQRNLANTGWQGATFLHGQCRFVKSGSNLLLIPHNGMNVVINGISQPIPSAGVSMAPAGSQGPVSGSSYSITSNVCTYVTGGAHGLSVGAPVAIFASGNAALNGTFTVTSVTNATTFTFAVPASNVSSTSDSNSTVTPIYYAYAYMAGATMKLEGSLTGHVTDPNTGVEIKNGDATRTLVGMYMLGAGNVFVDSVNQRFVRSWFNRSRAELEGTRASGTTGSAAAFVEIAGGTSRVMFIAWAGEVARMFSNTYGYTSSTNNSAIAGTGFNGPNVTANETAFLDVANSNVGGSHAAMRVLNDGFGYFTPCAIATAGFTATISSALRGEIG